MVFDDVTEGIKRPRGRPFAKGNKKGKVEGNHMDSPRRENGDRGETISAPDKSTNTERLNEPELNANCQGNEPIDFIEFKNEKNSLKITLSKKQNRMYRIQIFLNDTIEIRPITYNGASTAMNFWNMLKSSLNK
jgi:hypothetical protein